MLLVALGGRDLLPRASCWSGASFFHQNGHGPNWIGYALGQPCTYGPGFEELFGWAARLRPQQPEPLVFGCNAALAATCPIWTWIVTRRVGAPAWLAWPVAAVVAIDPLLLRIAFTESYYVPYTALLLLGTAVALSAPTLRSWSPRFVLASAAAGTDPRASGPHSPGRVGRRGGRASGEPGLPGREGTKSPSCGAGDVDRGASGRRGRRTGNRGAPPGCDGSAIHA